MSWKTLTEESAIASGNFAKLFRDMEIPALPQAAVRLIELADKNDVGIDEVAEVITTDPGISAKLMRTVNSVGMGLASKIGDVRGAVRMLGLKRIRSLALGFAAVDSLPGTGDHFDGEAFWQTSLQQAVFAEALAGRMARGSEGEAFTGALLQNMAQAILLTQWTKQYLPVIEQARLSGRELTEVENEEFSWNHAQAGAWLARSWGFPDELICVVEHHHDPIEEDPTNVVLDIVRLADRILMQDVDRKEIAELCSRLWLSKTGLEAVEELIRRCGFKMRTIGTVARQPESS